MRVEYGYQSMEVKNHPDRDYIGCAMEKLPIAKPLSGQCQFFQRGCETRSQVGHVLFLYYVKLVCILHRPWLGTVGLLEMSYKTSASSSSRANIAGACVDMLATR